MLFDAEPMKRNSRLRKTLTLPQLLFYGVGTIIGAGVYSIIGVVARTAGQALWQSFVLAAFVALLTGVSYAELTRRYPHAGAEYVFVRKLFPRQQALAFLLGLFLTLAATSTVATVSTAFAGYFGDLTGWSHTPVALALILACSAVAILGVREAAWITVVFTIIEILGLAAVIGHGWTRLELPPETFFSIPDAHVFAGASVIFFVYLGFNDLANLAEEAQEPERHMPIAILASLGITTFLYVAVAIGLMGLTTPEEIGQSKSPLAFAMQSVSPEWANFVAGVALFSTANTALVTLIVAARILLSMGRAGELPSALAEVGRTRRTPWRATLIVTAVATLFLPLGRLEIIGGVSSLVSLLAFLLVNACAFKLHWRENHRLRTALAAAAILSVLALTTQFERTVYVICGVLIACGAALRWVQSRASA